MVDGYKVFSDKGSIYFMMVVMVNFPISGHGRAAHFCTAGEIMFQRITRMRNILLVWTKGQFLAIGNVYVICSIISIRDCLHDQCNSDFPPKSHWPCY